MMSTNLLGFDLEVPQNDSHVSLKLTQKLPDLISGGNGPLEPLHKTGPLELTQDTIQLADDILDLKQASLLELLSEAVGRLTVAFQKLCQTLSWMSANIIAQSLAHCPKLGPGLPRVAVASWMLRH